MPAGASISKIESCRALGALVHEVGSTISEALAAAKTGPTPRAWRSATRSTTRRSIAGQGTLGLELVDDVDDLACVIVPLGGGGLASGTAIAVKSPATRGPRDRRPGGRLRTLPRRTTRRRAGLTLADGIAVKHPGVITRPLVETLGRRDRRRRRGHDRRRDGALDGARQALRRGRGAVGVAALMSGVAAPAANGATCVVLSGGNVDLGIVPGLIRRHETQAGRRLTVFVKIDDRPGGLARLLAIFAASAPTCSRSSTSEKASTCTCARPACAHRSRSEPATTRRPRSPQPVRPATTSTKNAECRQARNGAARSKAPRDRPVRAVRRARPKPGARGWKPVRGQAGRAKQVLRRAQPVRAATRASAEACGCGEQGGERSNPMRVATYWSVGTLE